MVISIKEQEPKKPKVLGQLNLQPGHVDDMIVCEMVFVKKGLEKSLLEYRTQIF